jgi:hypothetical protein
MALELESKSAKAKVHKSSMKDFFISYNKPDRQWAVWIAWTLEDAGYAVTIDEWDFRAGGNFVREIDKALSECHKIVAILSRNYVEKGNYTYAEWAAAYAEDPKGEKRKLIPVRIEECNPEGILKQIKYIDFTLFIKEEEKEKARDLLLDELRKRGKPSQEPGFPTRDDSEVSFSKQRINPSQEPRFPVKDATEEAQELPSSRLKTQDEHEPSHKIGNLEDPSSLAGALNKEELKNFSEKGLEWSRFVQAIVLSFCILFVSVIMTVHLISSNDEASRRFVSFRKEQTQSPVVLEASFGTDPSLQEEKLTPKEYGRLEELLDAKMWREADRETFQMMLTLAHRIKTFNKEDILSYPCESLLTIDDLWAKKTDDKSSFSTQGKIWQSVSKKRRIYDNEEVFQYFAQEVGWRSTKFSGGNGGNRVENDTPDIGIQGNLPSMVILRVYPQGLPYITDRLQLCRSNASKQLPQKSNIAVLVPVRYK